MSENISSLKMMGPAETEEIDSLISVSTCNTVAVKNKVALSFVSFLFKFLKTDEKV